MDPARSANDDNSVREVQTAYQTNNGMKSHEIPEDRILLTVVL